MNRGLECFNPSMPACGPGERVRGRKALHLGPVVFTPWITVRLNLQYLFTQQVSKPFGKFTEGRVIQPCPVHIQISSMCSKEEPSSGIPCSFTAHEHTPRRRNTCRPKCRKHPKTRCV